MPKITFEDIFYTGLAERLNMDTDVCRTMYGNLSPEVRKELDNYIYRIKQMELAEELRNLDIFENKKSNIRIKVMQIRVA
jgi:hypothetical protein